MQSNTHPEFAGLEKFRAAQQQQLEKFRAWAAQGDWGRFHREHYDWWTFPTDEPSAYAFQWTLYEAERAELAKTPEYRDNLIELAILLMRAWGWDLPAQRYIENCASEQRWSHWPIRLYKCAKALQLFGCEREFESVRQYGVDRMNEGEQFWYNRDLSWLFQPRRGANRSE